MSEPSPATDNTLTSRLERASDLASLTQHGKSLIITAQVTATVIYLAIFLSAWGDRRLMVIVAGVWGFATTLNLLGNFWLQRLEPERANSIRVFFNLSYHIPLCIVCHWNAASWLFVPFFAGIAAVPPARNVLRRIILLLICFDVAALLTDGRWQDLLVFNGISFYFYFAGHSYLMLLGNLLRERDRNLRELREAHQRGVAQEKLASIGQIAAGIAHEINNPMCFVTANVEALIEDLAEEPRLPPTLVEYRQDILPETLDGIRRVNSIVGDLRRFARGEPDHFVQFDLADEIAAAVRMARTQMKPGQVLDLEIDGSLDMVGSPGQLCQVLLNLIMNGLQALPSEGAEPGRVLVAANENAGTVEIAVRDNGAGMSEETRRRLFEPFFTTKAREGIGLGLSVVYGIIQSHGGTIEIESAPGRGSSFCLKLPRTQRLPAEASEPAALAS